MMWVDVEVLELTYWIDREIVILHKNSGRNQQIEMIDFPFLVPRVINYNKITGKDLK